MLVDSGSIDPVDPRIILDFWCLLVRLYKSCFNDLLNCVYIYHGVCQAVIRAYFVGTVGQVVHSKIISKRCVCCWKWFAPTDVCNWCSCFALHASRPPWNHDFCLTCSNFELYIQHELTKSWDSSKEIRLHVHHGPSIVFCPPENP